MAHRPTLPIWVALFASGLAGALIAVQSRLNGGLGKALGDAYLAALISFGTGTLLLVVALLVSPVGRRGLGRVRDDLGSGRLPWWSLTGGACGAVFVFGQGAAAPVVGVALFTVGVVAGQVLGGLVVDRIGVGPGGRMDPSRQRLTGGVLAVLAVGVSVAANLSGATSGLALVVIPFVAGLLMSWQTAVNGLLRVSAHSALTATFISFAVGTVFLMIAAGVSTAVRGWPEQWPSDPWLYAGGALGIVFVALSAALVRTAGVLLLGMSSVAGQLVSAVAIEAGLPLAGGVTPWMLAGATIALIAVGIAALPSRAKG